MICHPERSEGSVFVVAVLAAAMLAAAPVLAQEPPKQEPLAQEPAKPEPFRELDTPYVPTPQVVVDTMLDLAGVKAGDMVIDLGSGDGRLVITAAQKYGAHGFGVEIDPRLVQQSNQAAARAGVADRVKFLQQDLFQTDFHEANVLTLYLLPDVNMALRPKILEELKPGSRVVSHDFDMREWKPDAQLTIPVPDKSVGARKESRVYLWIVPANVEGEWMLEIKDTATRRLPLTLAQHFQVLSGSVRAAKGNVPILGAKLRGDALRFVLPAGIVGPKSAELSGRLSGGTLSGSVRSANRVVGSWSARKRS